MGKMQVLGVFLQPQCPSAPQAAQRRPFSSSSIRNRAAIRWHVKLGVDATPCYPIQYESFLGHAYYRAGRYEEAVAACKKALTRIPNYLPARLFLVATYNEIGQAAKAQAEAAEVMRIIPIFSVAAWGQRLPYKDPADVERFLVALRKAGLK